MNTFLNPEDILDKLELRSDMLVADFGCGSGGFTIPLAREVEDGLVYGLDIQGEPLSALKGRILLENIKNIKIIKTNLENPKGSTLPAESVDMVLIPNVLFQIENKSAIILEALRILKNSGKLVIIDWLTRVSQGPAEGRISKEDVIGLAKDQGLNFEKEFDTGRYHYGIVFSRG
ncbi:class I SAM-dependent methyltransferase [Patescibacteria group bacterium]|nr:class I SAM-dependent methyltransferase [Patescibacteria group bacterium]